MQVNDLVVTGDARILGNLYTKDGNVSGGSGGSSSGDSGVTYKLSKSGSTITLTGSDGSTSSVTDANTDTNTTYSAATTSAAGLMSASDKSKLDGITASADTVSFSRSLSSGTKIGTITINGTGTDLYCQTNTDTNTTYSAGAGISLSGTTFSNSGVRSIATGGSNGTISVNTNGSTANVAVKGLGSAAYTNSNAYLAAKGQSAYDCNTCYDGGLYMIANGKNCPSGSPYGTLLVLPYRKNVGNTSQDFAVQIFIPNGDDSTRPNSMFYRTSIQNSWAHWNEVSTTSHTHSYLPLSGGKLTGDLTLDSGSAGVRTLTMYYREGNNISIAHSLKSSFGGIQTAGALTSDYVLRNEKLSTSAENPSTNGTICWQYA